MPTSAPVATKRVRESPRAQQDHGPREDEHQHDRRATGARRERAQVSRGSDQVGLLGRRLRHADRVHHEDRHEHQRVERRDRVLQRQGQRVDRGGGQVRELHRVAPVELDALPPLHGRRAVALADPVPRDEHDHGPADPDQEPVGARHVGEREPARRFLPASGRRQAGRTRRLERVPALPREDEVDRVLGEDGDERQHRDRQSGGDVELCDLRGPRQDERGSHDGQTEQRGLERVRQIRSRRTDHQRGHGGGDRQHERDALS